MTGIMYDLPRPPEGEEWCSGCVMLLRGRIDKEYASMVAELSKDGKDDVKVIKPDKSLGLGRLQVAVVTAVFEVAPDLGLMRLCWTCAAGIAPVHRSPLAAAAGLPPGLMRGRG